MRRYRHVGMTDLQYRKTALVEFKGVDYSSQRFKVSPSRAIDELNFIYKDGCARKREGFTIIGIVPSFIVKSLNEEDDEGQITFTNGKSINGLWKVRDSDGITHTIAHIGKILCDVIFDSEGKASFTPIGEPKGLNEYECYTFDDFVSTNAGFVGGNKFWFLGGTEFSVVEFIGGNTILTPVSEWEGVYVPTTTINITKQGSSISQRTTLDPMNLMTEMRVNEIVSSSDAADQRFTYVYILDSISSLNTSSRIDSISKMKVRIEHDFSKTENESPYITENLKCVPIPYESFAIKDSEAEGDMYFVESEYAFVLIRETDSISITDSYAYGKKEVDEYGNTRVYIGETEVFGFLHNAQDTDGSFIRTELTMFNEWLPKGEPRTVIWVTYPVYDSKSNELINKCHFGHLFGNANAKNRLFVSGNNDLVNCDWHSGEIPEDLESFGKGNGNFSYFPDTSYCFYGQTDNKIVGYDIISDSKMVVLKSKSDKEPTIYYRTSNLATVRDESGFTVSTGSGESLYKEEYPLLVGNISKGALSNNMICNFNGDTLFVTCEKEIHGLDISETLADSQRYSHTRSKYIDARIRKEIDEDSVMWTDGNYLILSTKECSYFAHIDQLDIEERQYEWWKQSIGSAASFLELGDRLYFGRRDGMLCLMRNGSYEDRIDSYIAMYTPEKADTSRFSISAESASIFDSSSDDTEFRAVIGESDEYKVYYIAKKTVFNYNENDDCIELKIGAPTPIISAIMDNGRVFVEDENEELSKEAYVTILENSLDVQHNGLRIRLEGVEQKSVVGLLIKLEGEFLIRDYSEEDKTIRMIDKYGIPVTAKGSLGSIHYTPVIRNVKVYKAQPVKSFYITAPITMGDLMRNKTFWAWTIVNDTDETGDIEVCQVSNESELDGMMSIVTLKGNDYGFDLGDISFFDTSFSKCVVPFKYTYNYPLNSGFLCLGLRNNDNTNCVLSSLQVLYTLSGNSFGNY